MFVLVLIFEFDMFEFDIFEFVLTVAIGVAIGVGLEIFEIRLLLLAVLLATVPPHPAPMAPIANTAISAIVFMILSDFLSSSKLGNSLATVSARRCLPQA